MNKSWLIADNDINIQTQFNEHVVTNSELHRVIPWKASSLHDRGVPISFQEKRCQVPFLYKTRVNHCPILTCIFLDNSFFLQLEQLLHTLSRQCYVFKVVLGWFSCSIPYTYFVYTSYVPLVVLLHSGFFVQSVGTIIIKS